MNSHEHIQFITGRLAAPALQRIVASLAEEIGFSFTVDVLPISVAALMTPDWMAKHVQLVSAATRVIVPGYCGNDLSAVEARLGRTVVAGPRDLHALPEFFGQENSRGADYGGHTIEILAEVNHAPRFELREILQFARDLQTDGADVIDLGCDPGSTWSRIGECVRALVEAGHRVSVDSLNIREIENACRAGAELVLSVNQSNVAAAPDWGRAVVAIPDDAATLQGLDETIEQLAVAQVPYRIDPILEPIGFGFAASLARYHQIRSSYPHTEMMMGIGNLTELTDVDSAGINVLLLAFCEELNIGSVLTTQVINWARSSVRECDLARRLVHFAVSRRRLPKHLEPGLVMLRDPRLYALDQATLQQLSDQIKDRNYRLFAQDETLHLLGERQHLTHDDPFELFAQLMVTSSKPPDAAHAFYLGYELSKAVTALTLGKQYRQDEALDWGCLTKPEVSHRSRRQSDESSRGFDPNV